MTDTEARRLIGESIAIVGAVAGAVFYVVRQVWRVLDSLAEQKIWLIELKGTTEKLAAHQENMNGQQVEHAVMDDARFAALSNRLSHIEGKLGLPLKGTPE